MIRFVAADAQAQALENGEIQAMDPQPNPDLLAQLDALGDRSSWRPPTSSPGSTRLQLQERGVADKALREAFALCVPRQTIVDNLIKFRRTRKRL